MSWVSKREDDLDRFTERLNLARARGFSAAEGRALLELFHEVHALIREARDILQLARAPESELAARVRELEERVQENEKRLKALGVENADLSAQLVKARKKNTAVLSKLQKSRDFFARHLGAEKLAAYDHFMKNG